MSNPTDPQAFSSSWNGSQGVGKVVNINDRGNRVQVRIFGYQDDKGNIPDEKLEWIGTVDPGAAQIAGASKTHNYYVGSIVAVNTIGNQKFVMGAVTGYDSDKTNKKDSGADTSENKDPNIPKQARGEGKKYAGQGEDKTAKASRNVTKTDKPYDEPQDEKVYDHSKQKAPYDKGTQSKFHDKKSIGIDKNAKGSDVLDVIKQLDGNESGAIKSAIELIKNLRNNGFGKAMDVVGAGALAAAGTQHDEYFGAAINLKILQLIQALLEANTLVGTVTIQNIQSLAKTHKLDTLINVLSNEMAAVSISLTDDILGVITRLNALTSVGNNNYLNTELSLLRPAWQTGLSQAVNSIINAINNLAVTAGGAGGLITILGGPEKFQLVAAGIRSLAAIVGIPLGTLSATGFGAIGVALTPTGTQENLANLQQNGGGGSGGSNPAAQIQSLIGNMNMFQGNQIALGENGSINPETLSKIAIKYAKKKINDPQKSFFE